MVILSVRDMLLLWHCVSLVRMLMSIAQTRSLISIHILLINSKNLEFDEEFVVSVDVADTKLLGEKLSGYADKIDLCIDHHGSNTKFAKEYYVEASAAAAAQVIEKLIRLMNVEFDKDIANAIYTGITTDTGCFRYTNVTAETHRIAADMIDCGAESGMINRLMFETKSRSRLEIERRVMDSMQFYLDGRCGNSLCNY